MGQMLSGAGGGMNPQLAQQAAKSIMPSDVAMGGAVPQAPAPISDPAASAAAGEHPGATNMKANMGFMSKLMGLLGDTQEEREKNAEALSAMVQDIGSMGKTASESSLMRRMMTHQMRPLAVLSEGNPAGGVAAIPNEIMAPVMAQMGFR